MTPGWAAFLGLTGLVLAAMLLLARQSQRMLEQDTPGGGDISHDDASHGDATGHEPPMSVPGLDPAASEPTPGPTSSQEEVEPEGLAPTGPDRVTPAESKSIGQPGAPAPPRPAAGRGRPSLQDLSPIALLANVAFTHGLLAGIVVAGAWYFEIPAAALGLAATPEATGAPAVLAGVGLGVVLWLANEVGARVADAVGFDRDESLRRLLGPESASGWVLLLGVVLPTIAVGEELLFRGALIGVPAAGFGLSPWALAVVSAVAFALGHGAQGRAGIVVTGLLGLVLAAAFVVSGSLLLVIVAHYVVNALEFLVHEAIEPGRLGTDRDGD